METPANEKRIQQEKERERLLEMISWLINAIVPIVAFSASLVILQVGIDSNWDFIAQFKQPIQFPQALYNLGVIGGLFKYISTIQYLKVILMFFILAWILFAGFFSVLNAFLYKTFGPSLYSNVDVPTTNVPKK